MMSLLLHQTTCDVAGGKGRGTEGGRGRGREREGEGGRGREREKRREGREGNVGLRCYM